MKNTLVCTTPSTPGNGFGANLPITDQCKVVQKIMIFPFGSV